jgi:ribonucleoside-diphosphate reductase alpha chain
LAGLFTIINKYLIQDLIDLGIWSPEMKDRIIMAGGSIQELMDIPEHIRVLYKTVWEIKQRALIDLSVARGRFIDQAASLNLFMTTPEIEKLSAMYMYAWENGVKTTYYLRSKAATNINKLTSTENSTATAVKVEADEVCESCQ